MATKKTSKAAKTRAANAKKQAAQRQLQAILLFAGGLLVFLLALMKGESGWLFCHNLLLGLFSFAAYLIGPLCILVAVLISLDRPDLPAGPKAWEAAALVLLASGAAQVFAQSQPDGSLWEMTKELYIQGGQLNGGGVFALLTGIPLLRLLDFTGAAVVICLLLFVLLMILTGSTLAGLMKKAAAPVQKIGEAYAVRKESAAQAPAQPAPAPAQQTLRPAAPVKADAGKARFDIDIPVDEQKTAAGGSLFAREPAAAAPVKANDSIAQARDRLLGAAQVVSGAPAPAAPQAPAAPVPADGARPSSQREETPAEPHDSAIDDLISRAIGGEAVIDDPTLTAGAEAEPAPAPVPQPQRLDFKVTGDMLTKGDGEPFIVPPVDPPILPQDEQETPEPAEAPAPAAPAAVQPAPVQHQDAQTAGPAETPAPEAPAAPAAPVYRFPPIDLLEKGKDADSGNVTEELKSNAQRLVDTLKSFGVQTRVVDISRGPAVTRYELQPSAGVKISRITGLADDIALNLASAGVRIEAPIPNKSAVGIEVPNKVISPVTIREVIDSPAFADAQSRLTVALGKDIAGNLTVADLARMPHLLIAGATGSGKSVCINSFIISLLYKATPDQVKLMMVDPKVVELGSYNGIPHLLVPVVTDPRKAAGALCWAVGEMMNRYKLFSENNVRDISGYNRLAEGRDNMAALPHIVIIIDELSDLMMVCPSEVEDYICRLAQMARAAGMHLVIATQRPSVDVITGIIKANIPSRIAFAVSSQVDSRTILDFGGAEKLLGRGDMLYYPVGSSKPTRVQGCFVNDHEVERVVEFVKNGANQEYDSGIIEEIDRQAANTGKKGGGGAGGEGGASEEDEELVQAAIEAVVDAGQASTSYLQRKLKLGYARAARIVDELESRGIVGPFEGSKPRQVLISKERWYEMKLNSDQ